jgi:hypothetical protein
MIFFYSVEVALVMIFILPTGILVALSNLTVGKKRFRKFVNMIRPTAIDV